MLRCNIIRCRCNVVKNRKKRLSLALQGGGSHGAFTWGVLDRLLEEESIALDGVSGTSAGAMNAVVMAQGLATDGRQGARDALAAFWKAVGATCPWPSALRLPGSKADDVNRQLAPLLKGFADLSRRFTPQQMNPLDINPLRGILNRQIDFEMLRRQDTPRLFVVATRVQSGQMRIFTNAELSTDVLLASACLPSLHRPVEIDGDIYWDGAYSGNPAVFPLVYDTRATDIALILLQPLTRDDMPSTAEAISHRVRELGMISPFLREMRAITHARGVIKNGLIPAGRIERRLRKLRFYLIQHEELMNSMARGSQLNTHSSFLTFLRDAGRVQAENWLQTYSRNPRRAQIDLPQFFGLA
jgi:NTE family protein